MDLGCGRLSTQKTYESLIKNWILPYVLDPQMFDESELEDLILVWKKNNLSPSTIKMLISQTKKLVKKTSGRELDTKKYVTLVMRNQMPSEPKALTKEEAHKLLTHCKDKDKLYPIVLLGMHTGMRIGEIFGLHWDDVDPLKGEIIVRRSYDGPTKNGRPRKIPMTSLVETYFLNSDNYLETPKGPIFNKFDPNPLLRGACYEAKIPSISCHGLRHTFATLALEAGRSPKQVQSVLGHSSLTTTLNIYWSNTRDKMNMDFLDE